MAVLLAGLAGCGGVRLEHGSYVVSRKGYRVGAPDGWTRIDGEADVALRQPDRAAGLMAHATCEDRTPSRPLPVLTRHLRFGLRNIQDLTQEPVTLGGLPGTTQQFRATLDGTAVLVRAVTLRGTSCVYDLVGVAPPEAADGLAADFERFTAGFALSGGTP